MNNSNEINPLNCIQIKEFLIKATIEDLANSEIQKLEMHLESCSECRYYKNTILSIEESIKPGNNEYLVPNPAIKQNLLLRMNSEKQTSYLPISKIWNSLKGVLKYKIPVYQGLIGAAIGLFLFILLNNLSISNEQNLLIIPHNLEISKLKSDSLNVVNNILMIDQQRIGISVKDDTLTTRFMSPSL